jgi:hypothetical protein
MSHPANDAYVEYMVDLLNWHIEKHAWEHAHRVIAEVRNDGFIKLAENMQREVDHAMSKEADEQNNYQTLMEEERLLKVE